MIAIAITIIKQIKKRKAVGNYIVIEILTCFTCLINDGFSQVMCIASFSFNLQEKVVESMISKHSVSHNSLQFLLVLK